MQHTSQYHLLYRAFQQNRLSHAYLLTGVAGLGKTDFARHFSHFLLCEKTQLTQMEPQLPLQSKPCNQCRNCKQFQANTHPDFIFIEPTEKSHAIKIDQIRSLSQKISQTAHNGGYQIVVISPADAMPIQAANALLKTLEEPHGRVIIFLIDNQQHPLPNTIASRCQTIYFRHDDIQAITKNHDAALCNQLLKHLSDISERRINPIAPINHWIKQDPAMLLDILILFCVDITRLQLNAPSHYFIHPDNQNNLRSLSKKISTIPLQHFIELLLEKKAMVAKGIHLNTQLFLENIFIAWEKLC